MNAVEIEEAVSELAGAPFDASEFPFAFLEAFGNRPVTVQRLRAGSGNASDVMGGVLQRNNIHMAVCAEGRVSETLGALRCSPKTGANKVKFVLATDGLTLEAEELVSGEPLACPFPEFANHFAFFLPLAGISTIKQIKDNPVDIKATGRLNKLYIELLKDNPDWATAERRHDLNHFMARLIFCLFAEDTGIFLGTSLFSATVERMSDGQSTNTHVVISELFRAMNTKIAERATSNFRPWADAMPYVNGGLFSGSPDCPRFSKIARSYLLRAASLNWQEINPDIFGSMIQAVADDDERGALGMHYTSVPNILKVLNPLFLDDLRQQLDAAGDNGRALLNLRKRMAKIRVFDPACGSGNFLVIAYKEMRAIEAEINRRRREPELRSEIPKTNFRGIELRDFPAEIARLALIIAEYQCDVLYRGQQEALAEFLPLDAQNWITCGNSLRLDWRSICPPTGTGVRLHAEDLFHTPVEQAEIDFENEGGETYVCGNPPYIGGKKQSLSQKEDMASVFSGDTQYKNLDYVCAFLIKACRFLEFSNKAAIVTTNSVNQGTHVPTFWPMVFSLDCEIEFGYEPFKWSNSAQNNAGVACTILGLRRNSASPKYIFGENSRRAVDNISPYLTSGSNKIVQPASASIFGLSAMITGNAAYDGGHLFLDAQEAAAIRNEYPELSSKIRRVSGTSEFIDGVSRFCLWFDDLDLELAKSHPATAQRVERVLSYRQSGGEVAVTLVKKPHQFRYRNGGRRRQIIVPQVSSERREYFPVGLVNADWIITHLAHAIYDPTLVDFSILSSRLHLAWIATICGKLESRLRYASNLGWNTFPVPQLTDKNKTDLTRCAEDILLAREAHYPKTIADLYDPDEMPVDLRHAHERNDETLERIYIGRTFRNDTERLEKLFEFYGRMTASDAANSQKPVKTKRTKVHR